MCTFWEWVRGLRGSGGALVSEGVVKGADYCWSIEKNLSYGMNMSLAVLASMHLVSRYLCWRSIAIKFYKPVVV